MRKRYESFGLVFRPVKVSSSWSFESATFSIHLCSCVAGSGPWSKHLLSPCRSTLDGAGLIERCYVDLPGNLDKIPAFVQFLETSSRASSDSPYRTVEAER